VSMRLMKERSREPEGVVCVSILMPDPRPASFVDGVLPTPSGQTPTVRTIWIVDAGADTPRLVSAYPKEQEP
jgi:hypothetical protein